MSAVIPLELIDKCVGSKITVLMSNFREFDGSLLGFDDFVNVILEDVVEYDTTGEVISQRSKILLNNSYIAMLVPGGLNRE